MALFHGSSPSRFRTRVLCEWSGTVGSGLLTLRDLLLHRAEVKQVRDKSGKVLRSLKEE